MFPQIQDMDLKALGFDVAEGVNDPYLPGDCGIVVTKVDKGSLAEGRLRWMVHSVFTLVNNRIAELSSIKCLFWSTWTTNFSRAVFLCRVNDWLLKINDVDLTNKDRKQVIKAVLSGEGVINMVVRRRKSIGGRIIAPVQINLTGNKGPNSPAA